MRSLMNSRLSIGAVVGTVLGLCAAALAGEVAAVPPPYLDAALPVEKRVADLVSRLTLEEKATLLNHNGPEVERFHIRADRWNQCLHGVWWDRPTTMFPVSIAAAATWNPALIHDEATAISDEARAIYNDWHTNPNFKGEKKGLIYRAPVINISRNPYWGRINECYGEDPYLTGRIGVAYVKGLQGDDPHYLKLVATLKHYAVNNVEKNRTALNAIVPERMLYEYWLPHFRDCVVEGHAQSLMASYNAINGTPNNRNHLLLTEILRDQWHFDGFVVSDLGGVNSMVKGHEKNAMPMEEAVADSINAGCDFSDKEFMQYVPVAVKKGLLKEETLDRAVTRVMRDRFLLGEFDPPALVPYSKIPFSVVCGAEHRALALKVAQESMTLLVNKDSFLPLDRTKIKTIAVIGPHAEMFTAGGYSGIAVKPVTPLQGIRNRAGAEVQIIPVLGATLGGTKRAGPASSDASELQQAVAAAKLADVVVLCLGTNLSIEAEGHDRSSLELPDNQELLAEAVMGANPHTVIVLLNAGPLTIPYLKDNAPAILEAWWNGEEGGNAIADVLFGNVNPGGKLPYTVYASKAQVPPQDEYDVTKGFTYMYLEGEPLFPFGHGLSYTTFAYSNFVLSPREMPRTGKVTASVEVQNTGGREGDEVVQLYVHQVECTVKQPVKKLVGFQRIHLKVNEKQTVMFDVPTERLAIYDVAVHGFVVQPGKFELMVGSSSGDIRAKDQVEVTAAK
jgi:beta-glucosidase